MGEFSDEFAGESIRSRRTRGTLHSEATREAMRKRAQEAAEAPSENDQTPWEVEAMEYFNGRLDEIVNGLTEGLAVVIGEQQKLHTRIDALVELVSKELDERSESRVAVEPKVVVTLENVPADVAEELQAELSTRVQRIMTRRAQHSDSC